jgi:FkbM family methyltransferase
LQLLCDPTRISVDVGAFKGIYSYYMTKFSAACHAFEPNPLLATELQRSLPRNVQVHQCALSGQRGETTLTIPLIGASQFDALGTIEEANRLRGADAFARFKVECCKLDDFELRPVGFIKIDVEGHELAVLNGSRETLVRDFPTILVEAEERHRSGAVESVRDFLMTLGYKGYFLKEHQIEPLSLFEASTDQDPSSVSRFGKIPGRTYVNDFIYTRDSKFEVITDVYQNGRPLAA